MPFDENWGLELDFFFQRTTMSSATQINALLYDKKFWAGVLRDKIHRPSATQKYHLIFSLFQYLEVPLLPFLEFVFTSRIQAVRQRAGLFMGHDIRKAEQFRQFAPAVLYQKWHDEWPDARPLLHEMIVGCAREVVLHESNKIINNNDLKVKIKTLTESTFDHLTPGRLVATYREQAPVTWSLLEVFSSSPNYYRIRKVREEDKEASERTAEDSGTEVEQDLDDVGSDIDEEVEDVEAVEEEAGIAGEYLDHKAFVGEHGIPKGFRRNPLYVSERLSLSHFETYLKSRQFSWPYL